MRDLHLPGRSPVYAANGMCATSHPLAAQAAIACLRAGGNAMDAALVASAVLCVVEPYNTGVGGDCFALVSPAGGGDVVGLNGSGRTPMAASKEWYLERGITGIGLSDVHSVTIPGAVDAWVQLQEDYGSWSLAEILAPAIGYAEEGFPVSPRVSVDWGLLEGHLAHDSDAVRTFMPGGKAPRLGQMMRLPALAHTLRLIGMKGRAGFYEGEVAQDLVDKLQAKGGLHTLDDFAATACDYVTPIRTTYRGKEVLEIPPNGQGITALLMLNILQEFDLSALDPAGAERFHLEMEAARMAYDMRDRYVADPGKVDVPVGDFLSRSTAQELAGRIDPEKALENLTTSRDPLHRDTVYLSVVDRDRMSVSFINSLYFGFGSGIVGAKSGVALQNRGAGFVVEEGHPNCIDAGKRPLHTIIPAMMLDKGKPVLSFGVMGGAYQAVGHGHVVSNMVDYGMDIQEALDYPRAFHVGTQIEVERGVSPQTVEGLRARGHIVAEAVLPHGGGQGIVIDEAEGVLIGGSDPRKDGAAIGY